LDNQATEPSAALNTAEAGNVFAALLDPEAIKPEADEPEAAAAQPEAPPEDDGERIPVVVDGKTVELTKAEIADAYKNGLRQSDYTKKTMATADATRAAEAEQAKARADRDVYAQNLHRFQAQLEGALQEQQKVDMAALLESDPVEYLRQTHLAQARQAQLQQVYTERQRVGHMQQAEAQEAYAGHLQSQQQELLAKLPEWRDAKRAETERAAIRAFLTEQGFDAAAVNSVSDSKTVVIARKAMLYDQMMSKAAAAAKKVSTLPTKVERPGVGNVEGLDRRTSAFQKLGKSGRVDDAAAVFAGLI
jgi:hypothetical protein